MKFGARAIAVPVLCLVLCACGSSDSGDGAPGGAGQGGGAGGSAGSSGAGAAGGGGAGGSSGAPSDVLCGERPGGEFSDEHVLRFESVGGAQIAQFCRVNDGVGAGESFLFHIESFAVVHDGTIVCIDDASLAYTNTHHNWDDVAEAEAGGVHYRLEFGTNFGGGSAFVYRLSATLADTSVLFDESVIPTGAPPFCWNCPGQAEVGVTELMPNNASLHPDEAGEFEPWIELYNVSAGDVDLTGYTLSNDFRERDRWTLPAMTLPRLGVLVIFADGEAEEGPLHTNFRLSPEGGELVLTRGNGVTDGGLVYGPMPVDTSLAFEWDEAGFVSGSPPTPGVPPSEE